MTRLTGRGGRGRCLLAGFRRADLESPPEPELPDPEAAASRDAATYEERIEAEKEIYAEQEVVHDLPPIFGYWSHTHLRPILASVGITSLEAYFADSLAAAHRERAHPGPSRFLSIGAGNCDAEVQLAVDLRSRGVDDFVIECLELNPAMLERGVENARSRGVEVHITGREEDFNVWMPDGAYDGVFANQALHHVVKLEGLFDGVAASLRPEGRFVVSDMIGRNGHERWPEARAVVESFWPELPESYRFHRTLGRQEADFLDWDCSVEGFEGIRAQDVLPQLLERFAFESFVGFANVIDVFIDRGFGPNFDPEKEWDRSFIDRVHERDVTGLRNGELKPTHMLAVLRIPPFDREPRVWGTMTPEFAARVT